MNPVLKRVLTGLTIGAAVVAALLLAPAKALEAVLLVLWALLFVEYEALLRRKLSYASAPLQGFGLLGAGLACISLMVVSLVAILARHGNLVLLYVLAIVKFSDVGGFAFGLSSAKLMKGGNHKMCPTISPNKSWEGLFGSVFCSCLVSCAFKGVTGFGWGDSVFLGVVAALFGTAGDLVESKFKRWVGVKDSSTMKITNGMGGFLDMFDSLLFAPAAICCILDLAGTASC